MLEKTTKDYTVRPHLGLLAHEALDGQVVQRASDEEYILETRAIKTPKGDYLLMFPEGNHYGSGKFNRLIARRSTDKGKTWGPATVAYDINYAQHGFSPLIPKGGARIYTFGTQPMPGLHILENGLNENAPIGFRYSDDDGHTWSEVCLIRPVNDPEFRGMFVMRMCETDAGTWLLAPHEGDSTYKPLMTRLYILRSTDQGKTWTLLPNVRHGGWCVPAFNRMDEGRCINLGRGKVLLMARTCEGHLWASRSEDDGQTWSQMAPTTLVHPDAPPMIFHLSGSKTLINFYHNRHSDLKYTEFHGGNPGMKDRSELWFATSTDGGLNWSEPRFLLANAAIPNMDENTISDWQAYQCSYLDMFADEGVLNLFLPHLWKQALHMQIKESDLSKCKTLKELNLHLNNSGNGFI